VNNPVQIRPATDQDVVSITHCARAAYHLYIERMGRKPAPMVADFKGQVARGHVHVLTAGDVLCGFAVCYPKDDVYFLENIAIHPDYQSSGNGARLLNYVHNLASGFDIIQLYTNEKMTENLTWYPSHGYVEVARRVEDGFARVYFEKKL